MELRKKLEEEAGKEGVMMEELIVRLIEEKYKLDPEARMELHIKLKDKYVEEAEKFIRGKDYVEASEKAWGAAAQIVKAFAAKEGKTIKSHGGTP